MIFDDFISHIAQCLATFAGTLITFPCHLNSFNLAIWLYVQALIHRQIKDTCWCIYNTVVYKILTNSYDESYPALIGFLLMPYIFLCLPEPSSTFLDYAYIVLIIKISFTLYTNNRKSFQDQYA